MTGLRFEGLRSVRPRTEPPRVIVLHWTGGPDRGPGATRDARGVYDTLRSTVGRHTPDGLSIHGVLEAEGILVEMASLDLACIHAGVANPFSIGLEMVSPGYPRTKAHLAEMKRGIHRDEYVDYIRGQRVRMLDYTEDQYATLLAWLDRVCELYDIPKAVPLDQHGDLLQRQMTPAELAAFRGVMGHFHCHDEKNDPGTAPFLRLLEHWGL